MGAHRPVLFLRQGSAQQCYCKLASLLLIRPLSGSFSRLKLSALSIGNSAMLLGNLCVACIEEAGHDRYCLPLHPPPAQHNFVPPLVTLIPPLENLWRRP